MSDTQIALPAAQQTKNNFSPATFFNLLANSINLAWTLLKICVVVACAGWAFGFASDGKKQAAASFEHFLAMASPLETEKQEIKVGRYAMPVVAVLAALPEVERTQNPAFTAAQLQRAKWLDRTWREVQLRNEPGLEISGQGADEKSGLTGAAQAFVSSVMADLIAGKKQDKDSPKFSGAEVSGINVLAGADLIPSLASGQLPVFTDSETAAWRAVLVREKLAGLSELDMRRAKYYQTLRGVGAVPEPAISDLEIRAMEKLESSAWVQRKTAAASDTERLRAACEVLNLVNSPVPAAPK